MNKLLMDSLVTEQHQAIMDSFCEAVGIAGAIIDLDGNVLIGSRWQPICTQYFRVNPETCAMCEESDTIIAGRLLEGKEYALYECNNGLLDAAAPIVVAGEHIANAFVGQFLTRPPDVEEFRRRAKQYDFPEKEFLAALDRVPIMDEARLPHIVNFLKGYAVLVAESYHKRQQQIEYERRLHEQTLAILELSTPVIKIWEGILVAPLIGTMDAERSMLFMERFLSTIVETSSPMALLDITGVPEVDTQSAQYILDAVNAARMLGAEVILTGVSPAIAQTLVHLGIELKGIQTRNTLAAGLRLAMVEQGISLMEAPGTGGGT